VGMRFFHPATRTRLVEISTLPETAPGVRLACENFCRWLDKSPVGVAEGEGRVEGSTGSFRARARHLRGALLASGLGPRSGR
jgi:3-hydroxyacyl-CoA dehydrogenase